MRMRRQQHNLRFASVEEVNRRLDSMGLVNRNSQTVSWKSISKLPSPNTSVGECVERLANEWFGENYNKFDLPALNLDLERIFREVGLLRDIGAMHFVILPHAVDENGNVVDPYTLLAEVLLP